MCKDFTSYSSEAFKSFKKFISLIIMKIYRFVIKTSDIATIFDVKKGTAREWLRDVRDAFGKRKRQIVTIEEFCSFKGVSYKKTFCLINKLKPKDYDKLVDEGWIEEPTIFVSSEMTQLSV